MTIKDCFGFYNVFLFSDLRNDRPLQQTWSLVTPQKGDKSPPSHPICSTCRGGGGAQVLLQGWLQIKPLTLPLALLLSLSPVLPLFFPLFLPLSLPLFLSQFLSLSLILSISRSLTLTLSLSFCQSLTLPCLYPSFFPTHCLALYLSPNIRQCRMVEPSGTDIEYFSNPGEQLPGDIG